ncbi:FHA domain protein [Trichuris suis]|nr:FHA domain protein [Trichuris suis]
MDMGEACIILSPCQQSHPFEQRRACVAADDPVKIGRAVAKVQAAADNFIFDCKVLSRTHAVVWYEDGSFFIRDTKSSNGTFVNGLRLSKGSEESAPHEVYSGDIVQLGVEIVENTKNGGSLTHGCIVAMLRLYHPNGMEALKRDTCDGSGRSLASTIAAGSGNFIQAQDIYQMQLHLRESTYREHVVETKLAALGALVSSTQEATEQCWQALIDEDRLLSRIETLESQLEVLSKNYSEDSLKNELLRLTSEKANMESAAKDSLNRVMMEKMEAVQRVADVEQVLETCVEECSRLRTSCEIAQQELATVVEQHSGCLLRMQGLRESLEQAEGRYRMLESQLLKERGSLNALTVNSEGKLSTDDQAFGNSLDQSFMPIKEAANVDSFRSSHSLVDEQLPKLLIMPSTVSVVDAQVGQEDSQAVLLRRLAETEEELDKRKQQIDDYTRKAEESRQLILRLQEELDRANEDLQSRVAQVKSLGDRLNISDRQLNALVEQSVRDILRRFEEVVYQKFKNEELVLFLKEQVRQLEQHFKSPVLTTCPNGTEDEDGVYSPTADGSSCLENGFSSYLCDSCGQVKVTFSPTVDDTLCLDSVQDKSIRVSHSNSAASLKKLGSDGRPVGSLLRELKDKVADIDDNGNHLLKKELTDIHGKHITLMLIQTVLFLIVLHMLEASLVQTNGCGATANDDVDHELDTDEQTEQGALSSTEPTSSIYHRQAARNQAEFASFKQECCTLRQRIAAIEKDIKSTRKENALLLSQYNSLKRSYHNLEMEKKALEERQRDSTFSPNGPVCRDGEPLEVQLSKAADELWQLRAAKRRVEAENSSLKAKLCDYNLITSPVEDCYKNVEPVSPTVSLMALLPVLIIVLALAVAFYPWLVAVTLTSDGPTELRPNTLEVSPSASEP